MHRIGTRIDGQNGLAGMAEQNHSEFSSYLL